MRAPWATAGMSAINILPMTDPDNGDRKVVISDTINDPIVTLSDPKPCRPA